MTPYLLTYSFYQKMSRLKFFSIKFPIEWAIWKLSTIILKFFEKKFSMGKNFWKSRGSSQNFNRFSIWKRFSTHNFWAIGTGSCKSVTHPSLVPTKNLTLASKRVTYVHLTLLKCVNWFKMSRTKSTNQIIQYYTLKMVRMQKTTFINTN